MGIKNWRTSSWWGSKTGERLKELHWHWNRSTKRSETELTLFLQRASHQNPPAFVRGFDDVGLFFCARWVELTGLVSTNRSNGIFNRCEGWCKGMVRPSVVEFKFSILIQILTRIRKCFQSLWILDNIFQ